MRYGAPAGNSRAHRVFCAAGCGPAMAPAGPIPTLSLTPCVARAVRVACAVVESHKEPTVGASARAARSYVALSHRVPRIHSTFYSTHRAHRASRVL